MGWEEGIVPGRHHRTSQLTKEWIHWCNCISALPVYFFPLNLIIPTWISKIKNVKHMAPSESFHRSIFQIIICQLSENEGLETNFPTLPYSEHFSRSPKSFILIKIRDYYVYLVLCWFIIFLSLYDNYPFP